MAEPIFRSMVINGDTYEVAVISNHDRVGVWSKDHVVFFDRVINGDGNVWAKSEADLSEVEAKQVRELEAVRRHNG